MIYWIWLYLTGRSGLFAFRRYNKHVDSIIEIFLKDYPLSSCEMKYDNQTNEVWTVIKYSNDEALECLLNDDNAVLLHSGTSI